MIDWIPKVFSLMNAKINMMQDKTQRNYKDKKKNNQRMVQQKLQEHLKSSRCTSKGQLWIR